MASAFIREVVQCTGRNFYYPPRQQRLIAAKCRGNIFLSRHPQHLPYIQTMDDVR